MPASMGRFNGHVNAFDENLANYTTLKSVGLERLIQTLIIVKSSDY